LHQKYAYRVQLWDSRNAVPPEMELDEDVTAERLSARLDAGWF
jgi:hypothetical protein